MALEDDVKIGGITVATGKNSAAFELKLLLHDASGTCSQEYLKWFGGLVKYALDDSYTGHSDALTSVALNDQVKVLAQAHSLLNQRQELDDRITRTILPTKKDTPGRDVFRQAWEQVVWPDGGKFLWSMDVTVELSDRKNTSAQPIRDWDPENVHVLNIMPTASMSKGEAPIGQNILNIPANTLPSSVTSSFWTDPSSYIKETFVKTMAHELGHSLGLLHPSDYATDGNYGSLLMDQGAHNYRRLTTTEILIIRAVTRARMERALRG